MPYFHRRQHLRIEHNKDFCFLRFHDCKIFISHFLLVQNWIACTTWENKTRINEQLKHHVFLLNTIMTLHNRISWKKMEDNWISNFPDWSIIQLLATNEVCLNDTFFCSILALLHSHFTRSLTIKLLQRNNIYLIIFIYQNSMLFQDLGQANNLIFFVSIYI